jgi:hypothetical protein
LKMTKSLREITKRLVKYLTCDAAFPKLFLVGTLITGMLVVYKIDCSNFGFPDIKFVVAVKFI